MAGAVPGIDGLPNYELRSVPQFVAGVNTGNVLDNPAFVSLSPGCCALQYNDPHQPPTRDMQWNFSIGREILSGIVARASYLGTHGWNLPQNVNLNAAPNDYVWYSATGLPKATGKYASTGQNAYDTTTYGSITEYMRRGYSNANGVSLELERRYSRGVGFQLAYTMTNAFTESTLVGNGGGSSVPPVVDFLPGAVPTDFDARNRFLNYQRDTALPHHQLKWNWVADLPFGRDHLLARNAGKFLNTLVGGWQLAGSGTYQSRYWSLPTSNYGPTSNIQIYGTKYPIQDCSAGACRPGYLYWNGYIAAADQPNQRVRPMHRDLRHTVELQSVQRATDSVRLDGSAGQCPGQHQCFAVLGDSNGLGSPERRQLGADHHEHNPPLVGESVCPGPVGV